MNAKLSEWLALSTRFLQARILSTTADATQFIEELNLRRETLSNSKPLTEKLTTEAIEGVYQVVGANAQNDEQGYLGMLTLKYDDNKIFADWLIEGEDVQTGFGILLDNNLSINFNYLQDEVPYYGVVVYEFLSKDILLGKWIEEGSDTIGVELGRKLPIKTIDPLKYFGFN